MLLCCSMCELYFLSKGFRVALFFTHISHQISKNVFLPQCMFNCFVQSGIMAKDNFKVFLFSWPTHNSSGVYLDLWLDDWKMFSWSCDTEKLDMCPRYKVNLFFSFVSTILLQQRFSVTQVCLLNNFLFQYCVITMKR